MAGRGLDCIEETGDGPGIADDVLGGGGGRGLLLDVAILDGGPGLAESGMGGGLIDGGFLDGRGGCG